MITQHRVRLSNNPSTSSPGLLVGYGCFRFASLMKQAQSPDYKLRDAALECLLSDLRDPIGACRAVRAGVFEWILSEISIPSREGKLHRRVPLDILFCFKQSKECMEKLLDPVVLRTTLSIFADANECTETRESAFKLLERLVESGRGYAVIIGCDFVRTLAGVVRESSDEMKLLGLYLLRDLFRVSGSVPEFLTEVAPILLDLLDKNVLTDAVMEVLIEACRDENTRVFFLASSHVLSEGLRDFPRSESFWGLMGVLSLDVEFKKSSFAQGFVELALADVEAHSGRPLQYLRNVSEYPPARQQCNNLHA